MLCLAIPLRGNCQNFSPSFEVYQDSLSGDTLIAAVFSLEQGRQLLLWSANIERLEETLAVKDSIIDWQQSHIDDLQYKVLEYDSATSEYESILFLKNTEVNALNQTIDLQQKQIKRQRRGKVFGIIAGVLSGIGAGAGAALLLN